MTNVIISSHLGTIFVILSINATFHRWITARLHSGAVVSTVSSQQEGPGSIPGQGVSVWSLCALPVFAWLFSGFLPQSENMQTWLVPVGVNVHGCLSLHVSPTMN